MEERVYQRDLKPDLFATQLGSGGQGRNLAESAAELLNGFNQRRARERPQTSPAPKTRSFLDQAGLSAVMRQQLGMAFGNLRKLALQGLRDTGVKRPSRLAQQR